MLQNEHLIAKIGVDTAENEPFRVDDLNLLQDLPPRGGERGERVAARGGGARARAAGLAEERVRGRRGRSLAAGLDRLKVGDQKCSFMQGPNCVFGQIFRQISGNFADFFQSPEIPTTFSIKL